MKLFVKVGVPGIGTTFRRDFDTTNKILNFDDKNIDPRIRALEYALKHMQKLVEAEAERESR